MNNKITSGRTGGQESKNPSEGRASRARKAKMEKSKKPPKSPAETKLRELARSSASRAVRGAARLADFVSEKDTASAVQAIREAMGADNTIYDKEAEKLITTPDHKTRLAAATLFLAYTEGTPVKRIEAIVHNARTPQERMEALQGSPEMMAAMRAMSGLVDISVDGEIIDAEFEPVQETGGENE